MTFSVFSSFSYDYAFIFPKVKVGNASERPVVSRWSLLGR